VRKEKKKRKKEEKSLCKRGERENQTIPVQCGVKRNGDEFLSFSLSLSLSLCLSVSPFSSSILPFFYDEYTHQRRRTKIKNGDPGKECEREREREREKGAKISRRR
jgi:hypothetical protein